MDDFADFFAATRDGAFRAVFAATGNRAAAEDAVAEAYARGYAEWHELRAHPTPIGWACLRCRSGPGGEGAGASQ